MVTVFTEAIGASEEIKFEDFFWKCANAVKGSTSSEPVTFHTLELEKARKRLAEVNDMDFTQCQQLADEEYHLNLNYAKEQNAKDAEKTKRYQAFIDRVEQWQPPTSSHKELKDFMRQQLITSMESECFIREMPKHLSGHQWRVREIEIAQRAIINHHLELQRAIDCVESHSKWLQQLRESMPQS